MTTSSAHDKFYSKAQLYDIAFSFKNIKSENDSLIKTYERINGKLPTSFLDVAAGPAGNAIDMAKRGMTSFALDLSADMVDYGVTKAKAEGASIKYIQGDMRGFSLPQKIDMAAIFMDSFSYLLTNDDVIAHLKAVAHHLNDKGLYFLEMSHPRDVFGLGSSALSKWKTEKNGVQIEVEWGTRRETFDPIQQITRVTAMMKYESATESGEIVDQSSQRSFTATEIDALIRASGEFEIVETLGSITPSTPISNEQSSWRMIPVLRKKP